MGEKRNPLTAVSAGPVAILHVIRQNHPLQPLQTVADHLHVLQVKRMVQGVGAQQNSLQYGYRRSAFVVLLESSSYIVKKF